MIDNKTNVGPTVGKVDELSNELSIHENVFKKRTLFEIELYLRIHMSVRRFASQQACNI